MPQLDVELDSDLLERLRDLAVSHYGDCADASMGRVVEVALRMRFLWLELVGGAGFEVGEPLVNWEFADMSSADQRLDQIGDLLFKERGEP